MEERDPGPEAAGEPTAQDTAPIAADAVAAEPIAAEPVAAEPVAEDIGRAAAEAVAAAEAAEQPPVYIGAADHEAAPHPRAPKRWAVVAGVGLTAIALATTATALAMAGSSRSHASAATSDGTSALSQTTGSMAPDDSLTTSSTDGSGSSTSQSTSSTTAPTTPTSSKPSPSTDKSTSATSSSSSPSRPVGTNETDCENTTHATPADEAMKFTGMTKPTQKAFLAAQAAAKQAGIPFILNSGYRSPAYQQRIFDCWVKALGSAQAARQYALPPSQSAHVAGYAMDIAPPQGAAWLESTNGKFGLCRRYVDETWHFEYQPYYKTQGCPALLPHP